MWINKDIYTYHIFNQQHIFNLINIIPNHALMNIYNRTYKYRYVLITYINVLYKII